MAKCTGMRCPMQYGYKVDECNHTDCPYRTEPMTNADRLDAMSIEEKAQLLHSIAYNRETPWSKLFYEKFCKDCLFAGAQIGGEVWCNAHLAVFKADGFCDSGRPKGGSDEE